MIETHKETGKETEDDDADDDDLVPYTIDQKDQVKKLFGQEAQPDKKQQTDIPKKPPPTPL